MKDVMKKKDPMFVHWKYLSIHLIQGRKFREAMTAVASKFGLVPLKEVACPKATVALKEGQHNGLYFVSIELCNSCENICQSKSTLNLPIIRAVWRRRPTPRGTGNWARRAPRQNSASFQLLGHVTAVKKHRNKAVELRYIYSYTLKYIHN